jgi:hypothetical protein
MLKEIFLSLVLLQSLSGASEPKRIELDVDFCQLPLPDAVKRANASFYVSATFQVTEDGKPTNIEVLKSGPNKYVEDVSVIECVKGWSIVGLPPGTRAVAMWRWNHGRGWEGLSISGPGISYRVKASGNRCPYLRP